MSRPTFLEGALVALGMSLAGSVSYAALGTVFAPGWVLRALIAAMGLAYVLYLLARSPARVGRVTVLAAWLLAAGLLWVSVPLPLYLLAHAGLAWLVRSLYFHTGLLSALADLGLHGLGVVAAVWAAVHAGSVFLAVWCFFLVQALWVGIPPALPRRAPDTATAPAADDRFRRARRAAESALRQLSSVR